MSRRPFLAFTMVDKAVSSFTLLAAPAFLVVGLVRRDWLFVGLLLLVRGPSALLWRHELEPRQTLGLALFSATGLPLIVAIVGIGAERDAISDAVGASLIGAGMISVLVFPLLGTRLAGGTRDPGASPVSPVPSEEY